MVWIPFWDFTEDTPAVSILVYMELDMRSTQSGYYASPIDRLAWPVLVTTDHLVHTTLGSISISVLVCSGGQPCTLYSGQVEIATALGFIWEA